MKAELPVRKRFALRPTWPASGACSEWLDMLPLPEESRKRLSLEHHLQLKVLSAGAGSLMSLKLLMRVALASAILQQLGYGGALPGSLKDYEASAKTALDNGAEGPYRFCDTTFKLFVSLVNHHDAQLEIAPWKALSHVAIKLEEYAGWLERTDQRDESYGQGTPVLRCQNGQRAQGCRARAFNRLQDFRAVAMRYDKRDHRFVTATIGAAVILRLRWGQWDTN